jgi:hypothetical protein
MDEVSRKGNPSKQEANTWNKEAGLYYADGLSHKGSERSRKTCVNKVEAKASPVQVSTIRVNRALPQVHAPKPSQQQKLDAVQEKLMNAPVLVEEVIDSPALAKGTSTLSVSVNAPIMDAIPEFSLSDGEVRLLSGKPLASEKDGALDHRRSTFSCRTRRKAQSSVTKYENPEYNDDDDDTKEKGAVNVNKIAPVACPAYTDVIHVIRHSTFHMGGGKERHNKSCYKLDISKFLGVPKAQGTIAMASEPIAEHPGHENKEMSLKSSDAKAHEQERVNALESLLELSAQLLWQERLDELSIVLKPFRRGRV